MCVRGLQAGAMCEVRTPMHKRTAYIGGWRQASTPTAPHCPIAHGGLRPKGRRNPHGARRLNALGQPKLFGNRAAVQILHKPRLPVHKHDTTVHVKTTMVSIARQTKGTKGLAQHHRLWDARFRSNRLCRSLHKHTGWFMSSSTPLSALSKPRAAKHAPL